MDAQVSYKVWLSSFSPIASFSSMVIFLCRLSPSRFCSVKWVPCEIKLYRGSVTKQNSAVDDGSTWLCFCVYFLPQHDLALGAWIGLNNEVKGDLAFLGQESGPAGREEKQDGRGDEIIAEAPSDSLLRAAKILYVLKTKGPTNLSDLVDIVENIKEPSTIAEVRRVCHVLQAVGLLKVVRADSRRKGYGGRPQSRKGPSHQSLLGDSDKGVPSLSEMILALAAIETNSMTSTKDDPNFPKARHLVDLKSCVQQSGSRQSRAFDGSTGEGVQQVIGQATEEAPSQKCTYEVSSVGYNHLRPSPRVRLAPQMSGLSEEEAVGRCGSAGPSDHSLGSNSDGENEDKSLLEIDIEEGRTNSGRSQIQERVLRAHTKKRKCSDENVRGKKLCVVSKREVSTTPLSHRARPDEACLGLKIKALSTQTDGQYLPLSFEGHDDASLLVSAYEWIWQLAESLPDRDAFLSGLKNDGSVDDEVPAENQVKCGALVMRLEDEHDRVLRSPHTVLRDVRWSLKELEDKKREEEHLLKELVRRFGVALPQDLQWETPVLGTEELVRHFEKLEKLVKIQKVKKVEVIRDKKLSQEEARAILHRRLDSLTGEQLLLKSRVRRNVRQRLRTQSSGDGEARILASLSCQGMTGEGITWREALQLSGFKGTESCGNTETLVRSNSSKSEQLRFDDKGGEQDGSYGNSIKDDLLDVRGEGIPWCCIVKQFQSVGGGNSEEKVKLFLDWYFMI